MKHYFSESCRWLRDSILGVTRTQELPGAEVDELLAKYSAGDVTKELFDFGRMLLTANDERVGFIDSKATTLVGYSSAILAFLLMRGVGWMHSSLELVAIAIIAVIAGLACFFAGMALRGAQNWSELGERTWFPQEQVLAGSDPLKRFYISAMHQVLQDNHRIANRKADQMILAQVLVALAGVLLAIVLTAAIATTMIRSFTSRPSGLRSVSDAPLTGYYVATCLMSAEDRQEQVQRGREPREPQLARHLGPAADFPAPNPRLCSLYSDYRWAS